ncbi:intermembrane transport protein PqiB [Burkholderia ubonensis]|uniref:Mammalian cell entry protein n=3 Tax=Burkholderia ubonensis TaxID=101571 RepID=A0A107FDD5_9BURK|nr:MlaD family protein [Burkholderia ubonensis]KWD88076.1 mammalian cell entry protein [Burkholderia ubonensis]KWD91428.1 mammalian cell entry protein [Burkholderia ubonensis]KWD92190.1 mammalian cell entry protein [Burkholderia ubonensis]
MTEFDSSLPPTLPDIRPRPRRLPSLVWLIPIVAAAIGLSLLIHALVERGPEVTVTFRSAEGLVPGKTPVRYKSVDIGLVTSVHLAPDHSHVTATLALTGDAGSFATMGTRFWVVRPRFAISGISGLDTLLSGAYIGVDAGKSQARTHTFTGLEVPPAVTSDASGKQFVLHAADLGSLDVGSPVYYRRVRVGQVVAYQLSPDGRDLSLRVFIDKPYDRLVTADTLFWHASGVDVKLDGGGLKVNTQSLATILLGGIAFQTRDNPMGSVAASENTQFVLASDQAEALKPAEESAPALAVLNFDQSLRGLTPGAPVDFRGIVVGQVRSIGIEYQRDTKTFRMPVVVELYPSRMGFSRADLDNRQNARSIAETMAKRGLRAQLRTESLLTGQLFVAFDFFPQAPRVKVSIDGPMPELATTPSTIDELQAKLGDIVSKVDKVPFDQIAVDLRNSMASLNKVMNNADRLVTHLNGDVMPQVDAALRDARKTLQSAEATLATDSPTQQGARRMMQELTRTATSLRALTDYLERHPEALVRGKTNTEQP